MRYPSGDTADQPGRRRRGHRADQPAGSQHPARQQSDEASVFVPGYAGRREAGESASGGSAAASPSWHGSSAGKGPVRGYPPLPGQPLPMYPPGQFAAWNRRAPGRARHASEAAAGGGSGDGSGYYAAESEPHTDPGYSMLAVSDPAADVTSTQTWQAVGDGRAAGTWTAPARPAAPRPPGRSADNPGPGMGTRSPAGAPLRPGAAPEPEPDGRSNGTADGRTRPGAGTLSPAQAPPGRPGGAGPGRTAPGRAEPGRSRSGRRPSVRRGKSHGTTKLAVAGALAIVLIGGAAVYLGAQALGRKSPPRAASTPKATPAATVSPTPSLGAYGYIASRRDDPVPLTVAELYPASFAAGGSEYLLTKSKLSRDCVDAVDGAGIQAAVSSASCSQVARATYLDKQTGMMGTIGVLNLKTAKSATAAAKAAGAGNFIAQLTGKTAPTSKIGHGTGIEEALAKGHYLILIWAELTSLKTPHKGTQRSGLEQFMTELLENTANVSLTNRMVNGSPSPAAS
jgi:hypothetical protein